MKKLNKTYMIKEASLMTMLTTAFKFGESVNDPDLKEIIESETFDISDIDNDTVMLMLEILRASLENNTIIIHEVNQN